MLGYRDGRFLHNLIRFRISQSCLNGEVPREFAIIPTKLLPALGIIPALKPVFWKRFHSKESAILPVL
jgi:hypothetical protein